MKSELMDKEVLCIYDVRAIQRYIFSSMNNTDILGAGDLVSEIHLEAFSYAMEHSTLPLTSVQYCLHELEKPDDIPYFYDENIQAQVVTIGGGNAFMIYRTGRIAQAVNKCYSRYLIEKSYSLQVAIATVERTDDFGADMAKLYIDLEQAKNTQPFYHPLGALPIVEKEENTGNPITGIDEVSGDGISTGTMFKRARARRPERAKILDNIAQLDQYHDTLAYIHIDGNSVGLTIGKIFSTIDDYEEGIRARRYLNRNFEENYMASLDRAKNMLKDVMVADDIPEEHFSRYFQQINCGGDDVNLVCASQYAFKFVSLFVDIVKQENLWSDNRLGEIKFSVCGGIAFVPSYVSYALGIKLAEQCCAEAKTEAKKPENTIDGKVGNWIDYQIITGIDLEDISLIREQSYVSNGVSLCLRPYCLDSERAGTPTYFGNLIDICSTALNKNMFNALARNQLMVAFSENILDIENQIAYAMLQMNAEGRKNFKDLIRPKLGCPIVEIEGRSMPCAKWYDALELINFVESEGVKHVAKKLKKFGA